LSLDSAYAQAGNAGTYNWCGGVCVGPIIGVVIGVLAGVGIIIGVIVCIRRRQAARQQDVQMVINTKTSYWLHSACKYSSIRYLNQKANIFYLITNQSVYHILEGELV